jgi:tRNA pseudouridine38-40 synthase
VRIALGIEYHGGPYQGWQSQPHGNTVQDHLETALSRIAAEPVSVVCAGRTDTGVHALAQVVHFDTNVSRPENAWVRGTNSHLPETVAVHWARPVAGDFHARFSAFARSYRYVLHNAPVRPALDAGRVGWFHAPLSLSAMQAAARLLEGERDFSSFRSSECQAKSPVRTLHAASVSRYGDDLVFDFRANAFLHHMVRNMVGALVYVGKGKHLPDWIGELLAARDRTRAAPTFSAAGLYLVGVDYESRWQLPGDGRIIAPFPSSTPWACTAPG